MGEQSRKPSKRTRFRDRLKLVAAALIICIVGVGVLLLIPPNHIDPAFGWGGFIGTAFFALVARDFRKKLLSPRFLIFVLGWSLVFGDTFVQVMRRSGWLVWLPTMTVELFVFYVMADFFFGVKPPPRKSQSPDDSSSDISATFDNSPPDLGG